MIYLDNAATSFKKPRGVLHEVNRCIRKYCGNPGRSSHFLSLRAAEEIYSTREGVAQLFGFESPENVVFTYNATYALNLAIKSFLTKDCHVITSDFEHNSVIRPIEKAKKTLGIEHSVFNNTGNLSRDISPLIKENTTCIITSIASNVTGERLDMKALSDFAREKKLFLIVDASQAAGHENIDLSKAPCDALCAPGHKGLFGIQGCGFALFKDNKRREGIVEGGSGNDSINPLMPEMLPEGYEAGTLATPSIVSLGKGIDFINRVGIENIHSKLDILTEKTMERLSAIGGVNIYGAESGIVSFNYKSIPSSIIASELDKSGICTRGGLHCAPSAHRKLGTLGGGTVRVSYSYFNSAYETDKLYKALRSILNKY